MIDKFKSNYNTFMYILFILMYSFVALNIRFLNNITPVLILNGIVMVMFIIMKALVYKGNNKELIYKIFILLECIILFISLRNDNSCYSQIFYILIVIDSVKICDYIFGILISVMSIVCILANYFISFTNSDKYILNIFVVFVIIFVYIIFSMLNHLEKQSTMLNKILIELKSGNEEKEDMYIKLKENSIDLEEVTIIKERNRIAREIHDTVGHTLINVIVQLEATEKLLKKDVNLAIEKLRLAKEQSKKGLNDIRDSVKTLKKGSEVLSFNQSLKLLINEIMGNSDININYEIEDLKDLSHKQEKTLFRALQEGVTNGIKHGNSTAFVFKLKTHKEKIIFFLFDNGVGVDKVVKGFGLSAMEERVKELGGNVSFTSSQSGGFKIEIDIPMHQRDGSTAS